MNENINLKFFQLTPQERSALEETFSPLINNIDKEIATIIGDINQEWLTLIWIIRTIARKMEENETNIVNLLCKNVSSSLLHPLENNSFSSLTSTTSISREQTKKPGKTNLHERVSPHYAMTSAQVNNKERKHNKEIADLLVTGPIQTDTVHYDNRIDNYNSHITNPKETEDASSHNKQITSTIHQLTSLMDIDPNTSHTPKNCQSPTLHGTLPVTQIDPPKCPNMPNISPDIFNTLMEIDDDFHINHNERHDIVANEPSIDYAGPISNIAPMDIDLSDSIMSLSIEDHLDDQVTLKTKPPSEPLHKNLNIPLFQVHTNNSPTDPEVKAFSNRKGKAKQIWMNRFEKRHPNDPINPQIKDKPNNISMHELELPTTNFYDAFIKWQEIDQCFCALNPTDTFENVRFLFWAYDNISTFKRVISNNANQYDSILVRFNSLESMEESVAEFNNIHRSKGHTIRLHMKKYYKMQGGAVISSLDFKILSLPEDITLDEISQGIRFLLKGKRFTIRNYKINERLRQQCTYFTVEDEQAANWLKNEWAITIKQHVYHLAPGFFTHKDFRPRSLNTAKFKGFKDSAITAEILIFFDLQVQNSYMFIKNLTHSLMNSALNMRELETYTALLKVLSI